MGKIREGTAEKDISCEAAPSHIQAGKMDMSSLSQVYCAVATEDRKLVQSGGRAIGMVMKHMTMKQVIRLSEHFRQYTSMEWSIDWKELDIREKRTGIGRIGITSGYWPWEAFIPRAITARSVWRR